MVKPAERISTMTILFFIPLTIMAAITERPRKPHPKAHHRPKPHTFN